MNQGQLVDELARRTGLPRPAADAAVRALFDPAAGVIVEELQRSGRLGLPGFGSFQVREYAARRGHDPRSGAEIEIPARRACTFTPRKGLRSSMKDMVGA
jgi:DNA-binding protein HU-beta